MNFNWDKLREQLTKIPKLLYSIDSEAPFAECTACGDNLADKRYMVEKAFKRYPDIDTDTVVFELAVCMDCVSTMREQLSKDSLQRIEAYFEQAAGPESPFVERMNQLFTLNEADYNENMWFDSCIVNGDERGNMEEYHVYAHCEGNSVIENHLPYMIGGRALEEIQELLSPETKEELEGFSDQFLGLPPELKDLFSDRPVLLV